MQRKTKLLLGLVLLLAILVRVWGIDYDLPYIYHPDEPSYIARSQKIFKTGDLNPHFFNYPSLFFYVNSLAYIPYFLAGKLLGIFQSPQDIPGPASLAMGVTWAPMPTAVLMGRLVTVSFGVGVAFLTYLVGKRLTNRAETGLLAALMVAFSPTNVWNNRFVTPDTFVTFFVLASFGAAVGILKQGKTRYYVISGICAGLAASSKYNGALIVLALLSAHFLRHGLKGLKDRRLYLALALSGLAFLATTPFALLDFSEFIHDLRFEAEHYATGHAGMEGDTLRWYLSHLWRTTGPISLLAVLAVGYAIYTRSKGMVLLAIFPVTYFLFIARFAVRNDRTIMPVTPFIFLLAASLLVHWLHQAKSASSTKIRRASYLILGTVALACLGWTAVTTAQNTIQMTTVNSRQTAPLWIREHIPPGAKIAIESYAPFVDPASFSVQGFGLMIDHPPEWYVENGFDYLIFSQGMFGRFYREPERYITEVSRYESFFSRFAHRKTFTDGGYEIRIYQVGEK